MALSRVSSLSVLCLLAISPVLAQNGDRKGEVQKPVGDHIKIPPAPVLSPQEEAATFKLAPGYRAELVAAEPLLGDPVAMQFAPDGRLWVIEMRGYMPNVDGVGESEPVGIISVLTDTDGDGRFDQRSVFADKLVMPRAIALVADGVLIAEPPRLWFLRDTNGDGKADEKTEIANDYGPVDNPEHSANGLLRAMDNWIYSAKHNVRFRWQGGKTFIREDTIPRGQWGIAQDDVGRIYHNSNSDPLRYDAVPSAYLKRNPLFPAAGGANLQLVPANLRVWPSRVTPGVNRGYQILNEEGKLTGMTAASAPVVYRGSLFPDDAKGDAFVPEPSGNLIKRIKLTQKDGIVTGANAYQGDEFMTSTDERFRPVSLYNGPDGALYIVDFYRGVIQHRVFVTSFLRAQIEQRGLEKGRANGRIWRIVPEGAPKADFRFNLAQASTAELVEKLGNPNGWMRDTAQRLLVERTDAAVNPALAQAAVASQQNPLARLHALWALEGRGAIEKATLVTAFGDSDPRVAAAAIRLSEKFLTQPGGDADLASRVVALVPTRTEPAVRLQLAFTLGEIRSSAGDEALRALAIAAGKQPFLADAIVSGLAGRELAFVEALVKNDQAAAQAEDVVRFAYSAVLKSNNIAQIDRGLALLTAGETRGWARPALLAGIRYSLPRSPDGRSLAGKLPAEPKPLLALAAKSDADAKVAQQLLALITWPGKPGAVTTVMRPLSAAEQASFEIGKAKFALVCAACHQPNGQGLPGLAPSLVNSRWLLGDPRITARIVLNGKARENLIMPPWKTLLDDESLAGVLTFSRRSWGHEADPVSVATVKEARAATATRELPFTEAELESLLKTMGTVGK
ncbi:MAG: c-type cytochrome [Opitutaceae bacterium]